MKLHAFDFGCNPRFRAFTQDKGRRHLQRTIHLNEFDLEIKPNQWKYFGVVSTTGIDNKHIRILHALIRQQGFAITQMPPLFTTFYVFDLALDVGDLRIYSSDRQLVAFAEYRKRLELSPQGESFGGGEPKLIGELEIPDSEAAKRLGLNYDNLQGSGFDIAIVRSTTYEESLRRYLNRTLPDYLRSEMRPLGIDVLDVKIHSVTRSQTEVAASSTPDDDISKHIQNRDINIRINNNNINQPHFAAPEQSKPRLFDGWIAKLLALLASIVAIITFLKD